MRFSTQEIVEFLVVTEGKWMIGNESYLHISLIVNGCPAAQQQISEWTLEWTLWIVMGHVHVWWLQSSLSKHNHNTVLFQNKTMIVLLLLAASTLQANADSPRYLSDEHWTPVEVNSNWLEHSNMNFRCLGTEQEWLVSKAKKLAHEA